jgi:TolB-like protein
LEVREMSAFRFVLGTLLLGHLVVPLTAAAQAASKATIAVLPFEIGDIVNEGPPLETGVLMDVFNRVLVNTRKFNVVDRKRLDRIRSEQKFGRSGLVDAGTRARIGKILGAEYLVMGTVTDYSVAPPREMAYGSGWTRPVRISVEVQVVDSSSGQIVSAKKSVGTAQSRVSDPNAAGRIPREALEKAAEEVANDAVIRILSAAYPIKIVDVSGDEVRLNRGEGGGVEVGSVLRCFAPGKKLIDPDTKESLGTSEIPAGSVRVTEVLAKVSVARVLENSGLAAGNSCREDEEAADEAGTHRAPPPPGPIHSY